MKKTKQKKENAHFDFKGIPTWTGYMYTCITYYHFLIWFTLLLTQTLLGVN